MSNRDQETKARIKTQSSLKDAAALFKTLDRRSEYLLSNQASRKQSLRSQLKNAIGYTNIYTDGRLIHKSIRKESKLRSKHAMYRWIYLERDHGSPFEHFEVQLFPVAQILVNSRKPRCPAEIHLPIYIKRHQLERISERLGKTELEKILKPLSPYIVGLADYYLECDKQVENGKFVMLTNEAYVVVQRHKKMNKYAHDYSYVLTTILPRTMWSNRRERLLDEWVCWLSEGKSSLTSSRVEPIVVMKPSLINHSNQKEIDPGEVSIVFG